MLIPTPTHLLHDIASATHPADRFRRMYAATVAIQASRPEFLAIVAPEAMALHPECMGYQASSSAKAAIRASSYATGSVTHGSEFAVACGGGR